MNKEKFLAIFAILILLFSPLASFPVSADIDPDEDNDSDGYDANRDGELSDEEKYTNLEEYYNNTNPNDKDTDDGLAWDGWEVYYGFNPRNATDDSADSDDDLLANYLEFYWDTNPYAKDTDQDGMPDGWEDSYSDRVVDGCGLDPMDSGDKFGDPDGDGSDNLREYEEGTNPCDEDSDDDGDPDGEDPPPVDPGEPDGTNPDTGATDGNVTIYEIFDPVLGTLKRWTSLDALDYDGDDNSNPYTMYNYNSTKYEIYPTNFEGYSNIFEGWIWMGITLSTSEYTMIPSVSPDADIIDYNPNASGVDVQFFKDNADNYYIKGNENTVIDLRYRMGTNGSYFNRPISEDLTLDDIPEEAKRPINNENEVKENVRDFLQYRHDNGTIANEPLYWLWPENGTPETNLAKIIGNLTWYFSAFIEGEGDVPDAEPPWDIYQSICINGIGACRHRSFGFFVTALALGAPTRYVSNEAHAFVEVYVPEDNVTFSPSHWKRINLGGTGSSNTLDRPDEGEEDGDTFDFDEMEPDDIDDMEGEQVTIVISSISPNNQVDKGDIIRIQGYVENQNNTRLINFPVGFGMWDVNHEEPIFEIGNGLTDNSGNFDVNVTEFLQAIPGVNEIYAASYKEGFLGVDGPENIEVHSDTNLTVNAPASVGKGQELVISGVLEDIGGIGASNQTVEFEIWEDPKHWSSNRCTRDNRYRCEIGSAVTDNFGNFVFSWTVPEDSNTQPEADDDYNIGYSFDGSTYLDETSMETDLIILESTVNLTAEISPSEQLVGNSFWVNGTVSDVAIANGNITIVLNGIELSRMEVVEVNWSFNLIVPEDIAAGDYTVIVTFDSEEITLPDEKINLDFTVLGESEILLDSDSLKITRGTNVIFEGELQDHLGEPLANEEIILKLADVQISTLITETDGDFSFEYAFPSDYSLGNVTWSAAFTGSLLHTGTSSEQNSVVFQQSVINVQVDKVHFYPGENMTVAGNLSLDNGTLFSGVIDLYFDDVFLQSFVTEGSFNFVYTPDSSYLSVGEHKIKLSYSEQGLNLSDTSSVSVYLHRKVIIFIEEKQVLRDSDIMITGFARDELSFGISGIDLTFVWGVNDLDGFSTTEFGGSFSKNYLVPNAQVLGKVSVQAVFDNTTAPYYDNASTTVQFTVVSETVIFLPDQEIVRGETIWFNGTILDDRGQAVEELEVNIFWNDEYIKKVTGDSNGTFSFVCEEDWECSDDDHPVGIIPVELNFGEIGYYLSSNHVANYTIWGHTEIEITSLSDVVIAGENITFEGFIENDLGVPLDREIKILWNDITRTTVTSFNGEFSGEFVLPYDTIAGNHTFKALVNDQNFLRGSSDSGQVLVMRDTEISVNWLGGFRNSSSVVSGVLRDTVGTGLSGQNLDIYFDEIYLGNTTTGDLGSYNYDLFIDSVTLLGLHEVNVQYNGSYLYTSSDIHVSSEVLAKTVFQVNPLEVLRVQEFVLDAYLVDDLGVPLSSQVVNLSFLNKQYQLSTNSEGYVQKDITVSSSTGLGTYNAIWNYDGIGYYLPNTQVQVITVIAATSISINSSPEVLVGESFNFSGQIVDDMGNPLSTELNFYFHGQYIDTLVTTSNGSFFYEYMVPYDSDAGSNAITVQYLAEDFYLPSSSTWQLQVYHNTRISMEDFEGVTNSSVTIKGYVFDKADRPIEGIDVRVVLESGFPIDGTTDSTGMFEVYMRIPLVIDLGHHNLTATFAGNDMYVRNSTTSQLFIQGQTVIVLEVPSSLEYNQPYSGTVKLQTFDGKPVSGASLLVSLEPTGMTMMVITDSNGTVTFDSIYSGNSTNPINVKVVYTGDEYYIASEIESTIVYRAPVQESSYALWVIIGAVLVSSSGIMIGWKWYRERHLREIQRILESTALALESNMDYRDSIVFSYKEMCKVLQGYGYLRRHFETVREFQQALQEALSLDHDSVARLTGLYEEADYTTKDLDDDHRLNAVSALRTLIESLDLNNNNSE